MRLKVVRQCFSPPLTPWHITFGTYGTRLHGGNRPTVDKQHNRFQEPFVSRDPYREEDERAWMKFPPRYLTSEQRRFAEAEVPALCERGGWNYRICAAGADHIHLLCDIESEVHGEKVRRLVKRWLGQALSEKWPLRQNATWWAEEGSNIAIQDEAYLNNCFRYVFDQRATPAENKADFGAVDGPARCRADHVGGAKFAFHINVFAAPGGDSYGVTWEDAAGILERLPRMIFEPDGSFVVSGDDCDGRRWQVDGHLFDFAGRLHRVELYGKCPRGDFDRLLCCVGWPQQGLLIEMVREGVTVDEAEFRRRMAKDA